MSSGTTDLMQAILDLRRALALSPSNREVARAYAELKSELHTQRLKDRRVFRHLFDSAEVAEDDHERTIEGRGGTEKGTKTLTW